MSNLEVTEEELDAMALAVQNARLGTPGAGWGLTDAYVKAEYRRIALAVVAPVAAKYEAEVERLSTKVEALEGFSRDQGVAIGAMAKALERIAACDAAEHEGCAGGASGWCIRVAAEALKVTP